jgi:hypothetical protein
MTFNGMANLSPPMSIERRGYFIWAVENWVLPSEGGLVHAGEVRGAPEFSPSPASSREREPREVCSGK